MDKDKDKIIGSENQTSVSKSEIHNQIITFFDKNSDFVFIYKKTEKLASALYLITGLFPDNEPTKWSLRKKVGELLTFMVGYRNVVLSDYKNFSDNVKTKILEIVSLLEITSRSGLLSFMNFSIIEQEFFGLIRTIDSQNIPNKDSKVHSLSKSFFFVPGPELTPNDDQAKNIIAGYESMPPETIFSPNSVKDISIIKDRSPLKRTNRQDSIVGLLRKRNNLNIKDISQVIKGCSEKTIQRELISLISAGIIIKTGERRWSRYSLAYNNPITL